MMKRIFVPAVFVMLLLSGCSKDRAMSEVHNFTANTWERFDFLNFEFPVENIDHAWDIVIVLRYNENFPSQALLVNLVMTLPSGEERIREYKLTVRDKDENLMGDKKAGYYERFIPIREDMQFHETGTLKFEIENLMTKYFTPGIVEFGIVLEPSE